MSERNTISLGPPVYARSAGCARHCIQTGRELSWSDNRPSGRAGRATFAAGTATAGRGAHYLVDCPVATVADLMGLPEGTVKVHLHKARATLHDLLEIRHA
ncbi:MAG: hypothetical protein H0U53_00230 [Actinobacteria bacterium]|nr:hypothetical protein [Actinomycetota bacterium]